MSYCGTCGGFFRPDCPQGPGSCCPAVNPFEMEVVRAQARITISNATIVAADATLKGQLELAKALERMALALIEDIIGGAK